MKSSPTKGEFNRGFRLAFPFPVLFIWPGERKDGNCLAKFSSYGQAITVLHDGGSLVSSWPPDIAAHPPISCLELQIG